jgi:hypothetical protein
MSGSSRWLQLLVPVAVVVAGCEKRTSMTLISNQENTVFEMRRTGAANWTRIGTGKILSVDVNPKEPLEIAATPQGYQRKTHTLASPVGELRFTFEISDRVLRPGALFFELDLRVVDVKTARTLISGRARADGAEQLRAAVEDAAGSLIAGARPGVATAVLELRQTGMPLSAKYADSATNMLISHLQQSGYGPIIERTQLEEILREHDLSQAAVVDNPGLLGKVAGVEQVILGSLAAMQLPG